MQRPRPVLRCAWFTLAVACGSNTGAGSGDAGMPHADPSGATGMSASQEQDLARVRASTKSFRSLETAGAAGYERVVQRCIAHVHHGAMGYHHTNAGLLDDVLEVERPEILVYERTSDGSYVLNGVEYIVPYAARPRDAEPPVIMGQELKRADGLSLWYLHVWIWSGNARGLFDDWNPEVECRP